MEVQVRGAKVEVRTVQVTKALLKQVRVLRAPLPEKLLIKENDTRYQFNPEYAVGWFKGTVLGEEHEDFILFSKDGDLYLYKYYKGHLDIRVPTSCRQLYIGG